MRDPRTEIRCGDPGGLYVSTGESGVLSLDRENGSVMELTGIEKNKIAKFDAMTAAHKAGRPEVVLMILMPLPPGRRISLLSS